MKIVISGSTGLIGTVTYIHFRRGGHEVVRLIRPSTSRVSPEEGVLWDIPAKKIERAALEGAEAVFHFAGANLAARRWTPEYKQEILESRVSSTRFLAETLAGLSTPPKSFFSSSAIGYYGSGATEAVFDEHSPPGDDFLADVCGQWEDACAPARKAGIRTVHLRTGVVLSPYGGALGKMLWPFRLGLGGRLGSGEQMFSWVALEEIPLILDYLLNASSLTGPVNLTAPHPVSNAAFTRILGDVLRRPTVLPVPAFVVKLLLGEMGETLLLGGAEVLPKKLLDSGYQFQYPELEQSLRKILAKAFP